MNHPTHHFGLLLPILSFNMPLRQLLSHDVNMQVSYNPVVWIFIGLQLLSILLFFKTRVKLTQHLLRCNLIQEGWIKYSPITFVTNFFFCFILIVFNVLAPFAVYLQRPMRSFDVLTAFIFCLIFLAFRSSFLVRPAFYAGRFVVLGVLFVLLQRGIPLGPTVTTLLLVSLFLAEAVLSISLQIYRAPCVLDNEG